MKLTSHRIAKRSATECAAILDVARELELVDGESARPGEEQFRAIVGSLVGLGKEMEREATSASPVPLPVPPEA